MYCFTNTLIPIFIIPGKAHKLAKSEHDGVCSTNNEQNHPYESMPTELRRVEIQVQQKVVDPTPCEEITSDS